MRARNKTAAQNANYDYVMEQTRTVSRYYVSLLLHKPATEVTEEEIASERARIFALREKRERDKVELQVGQTYVLERYRRRAKRYYAKNKEALSDVFVCAQLKIPKHQCPPELIALKRAQLKINYKLKALNEKRI